MSMSDILTEIEFGCTASVTKEEIKTHKADILAYRREKQAADLGVLIAKEKGWQMKRQGDIAISTLILYVFTPNELRDFIDAKLKKKLIELSERV